MNDILNRLIAADLPAATERVAVRLLAGSEQTPSGRGHLVMPWSAFCDLCNRANRNAARRHLTALAKSGLIHYSTAPATDELYITWLHPIDSHAPTRHEQRVDAPPEYPVAPAPSALPTVEDAPTRQQRRAGAPNQPAEGSLAGLPRAVDGASSHQAARPRAVGGAPSRQPPHTRADGGGGYSSDPTDNTTTNHPPGIRTRLRSLGLKPETVAIDAGLSIHEVAAILDAWEEDLRRGEVGTGALIYRLKNGITPPDVARLRHKDYKPAEYADIILG